ncbi:MAG: hypothetical protein FWE23_06885, partial [Chitinivibrionia bacterium]|nr:hypothetical protein [Chitinivibrionia bacterium]
MVVETTILSFAILALIKFNTIFHAPTTANTFAKSPVFTPPPPPPPRALLLPIYPESTKEYKKQKHLKKSKKHTLSLGL